MEARSLVGMTMGARKRRARCMVAELNAKHGCSLGLCWTKEDPDGGKYYRGLLFSRMSQPSLLRYGERLRPCPAIEHEGTPVFCSHCDGSGVLPAGRAP